MADFHKFEDGERWVHVVAGALVDAEGRVLIAQRPDDRAHAGKWEFPGGKREAGESIRQALRRELAEELGVEPVTGYPLIRVRHRYDDFALILDVWAVHGFRGEARGREGQRIRWVPVADLDRYDFPAANDAIIKALRLPKFMLVTPPISAADDPRVEGIDRACRRGISWVQLRPDPHSRTHTPAVVRAVRQICREHGAKFIVNGTVAEALEYAADGVHLSEARLVSMPLSPLPEGLLAGASCHSPLGLELAGRLDLDYASLSPVKATRSHPEAAPLGWHRVYRWARRSALPVVALGGLHPEDLKRAVMCGCQGIGMIRGVLENTALERSLAESRAALCNGPLAEPAA